MRAAVAQDQDRVSGNPNSARFIEAGFASRFRVVRYTRLRFFNIHVNNIAECMKLNMSLWGSSDPDIFPLELCEGSLQPENSFPLYGMRDPSGNTLRISLSSYVVTLMSRLVKALASVPLQKRLMSWLLTRRLLTEETRCGSEPDGAALLTGSVTVHCSARTDLESRSTSEALRSALRRISAALRQRSHAKQYVESCRMCSVKMHTVTCATIGLRLRGYKADPKVRKIVNACCTEGDAGGDDDGANMNDSEDDGEDDVLYNNDDNDGDNDDDEGDGAADDAHAAANIVSACIIRSFKLADASRTVPHTLSLSARLPALSLPQQLRPAWLPDGNQALMQTQSVAPETLEAFETLWKDVLEYQNGNELSEVTMRVSTAKERRISYDVCFGLSLYQRYEALLRKSCPHYPSPVVEDCAVGSEPGAGEGAGFKDFCVQKNVEQWARMDTDSPGEQDVMWIMVMMVASMMRAAAEFRMNTTLQIPQFRAISQYRLRFFNILVNDMAKYLNTRLRGFTTAESFDLEMVAGRATSDDVFPLEFDLREITGEAFKL